MSAPTPQTELSVPGRAFRAVAIAEAVSWAGLLIGMVVKYGFGNEIGVQVFGPVHGAMFILYVLVTAVAAHRLRWDRATLVITLLCGIPPLATLWAERRAQRRGLLAEPQARPATA